MSTKSLKKLDIEDEVLFDFKKECLLEELRWRTQFLSKRFDHQWQLRVLFLIFGISFLSYSLTAKVLVLQNLPLWQCAVGTILLFSLFFTYDAHLRDLTFSTNQRIEQVLKTLNDMPNISRNQLAQIVIPYGIRRPYFWQRWITKIYSIKEFDFITFYTFNALIWIMAWWLIRQK